MRTLNLLLGDGKGGQNTSGGPWSSFQSSNVSSGSPPNVSKETTKWFDTSDRLLSNACVYAVADKYCVSSLKALARSKFESLIKHDRLTKNFPSIALAVFESTPAIERGLRELVVDKAMKHLDTVLKDTEFLEVMLSEAQLPIDLLLRGHGEHSELSKQMLSIVDSYEAKIDTLKQDSAKSEQEVVASCEAKMGAFNQKLAKLQLEIAEPNHEITSYKAGIDTFKQKMAKLEQEYTASAEAGMDAVKQEVAKIKQRYAASSEARMDAFKQEIEKSKQKIAASYQARIDAFKQKAAGSEQEALQSRQELVKLRQDKYNLNASLTSLRQTMELKDRILEQTDDCRHCGAEFDCLFYAGEDCLRCAESGISAKIKTEEYGATEKARSS